VFENLVIAANRDGIIYAFRRNDGSTAWSLPVVVPTGSLASAPPGQSVQPASAPRTDYRALARTNRTLFVGSTTGYLIAYDLDTRREKWRYLADVFNSLAPQLGSDAQYVYVPSWSGRLASVNIVNGTEHWRIGDWKDAFLWPPVVAGNMVYASSATGLHALRR
jgi:outer membrane protein assembly factor BamB